MYWVSRPPRPSGYRTFPSLQMISLCPFTVISYPLLSITSFAFCRVLVLLTVFNHLSSLKDCKLSEIREWVGSTGTWIWELRRTLRHVDLVQITLHCIRLGKKTRTGGNIKLDECDSRISPSSFMRQSRGCSG